MKVRLRSLALATMAANVLAGVLAACGSGAGGSSGGPDAQADGTLEGGDARAGDAGTRDAMKADVNLSPSAVAYCTETVANSEKCHPFSAQCLAAIGGEAGIEKYVEECAAIESEYYGNAYLSATTACLESDAALVETLCCLERREDPCGNDAAFAFGSSVETCIFEGLSKDEPDPEDLKVRADFCKTCPDDESKPHFCAGFFDLDEAGLPDGASLDAGAWAPYLNGIGFGSFLLAYSDAVLDAIDTSCTGENLKHYDAGLGHVDAGVLACYAPFVGCATSVARAYLDAHPVPSVGDDEAILAACVPDAAARGD